MAYSIEQLKGVIGAEGGLAKSDLFAVQLPSIPGAPNMGPTGNILTKAVTLPAKQIQSMDRRIGGYASKIGNGVIYDDIALTFHVPNSMNVKQYFEAWMELIWNQETRRAGYYKDYAKTLEIKVLKKPKFDTTFEIPGISGLPGRGLVPDLNLGPLNANLAAGTLSLDFGQNTIQTIKLENAYPITMNPITMSNESAEFMELNVSFTFSQWTSSGGLGSTLAGFGLGL